MIASAGLVFAACGSDDGDGQATPPTSDPSPTGAPEQDAGAPGSDVPDELGRWTDQNGLERVYVAVETGITDDDLVALATDLHENDPEVAKFYFMDDDSRMDEVLAALPETEQGNTDAWPLDWVTEHTVATLELTIFPDDPQQRWILGRGLSVDPMNPLVELT